MAYRIITDSCCDLSQNMCKELDILSVPLMVHFRNQNLKNYNEKQLKEIYAALRAGEPATTSAANPQDWEEVLTPVLEQGQDALVLAFSSGLSTTYQSAVIAAGELAEKFPERNIRVVDTLSASMGQGLLVYYACQKRDAGMTLDELADWCEEKKRNICQWFTVDDLFYLKRGGRISAATAIAGTMLQIKPVLHVDKEGHLVNVAKTRGRKASIAALAKKMADTMLPGENDVVFISHGDCPEDAKALAEMLCKQCGVKKVVVNYVGAVIGSHSGPGTVAMFFVGKER